MNVENEVRYYYSLDQENKIVKYMKTIKELTYKGKFYEKTVQYDHPQKENSFYSKEIDARFRLRINKNEQSEKMMISYKRRLGDTHINEINKEQEVEITLKAEEHDNIIYILEDVLKMKLIESYERYRYVFANNDVEIAIDVYPFIIAFEIENKSEYKNPQIVISEYLNKFNLKIEDSYKLSWDDKYSELCRNQNIKQYNIVEFDKEMPKYENHIFEINQ